MIAFPKADLGFLPGFYCLVNNTRVKKSDARYGEAAVKAEARKLAIADYKKRTSVAGIYAVRCRSTGEAWVGQALDLDKIQNRIWFSLRMGSHSNRDLQRVWSKHGEPGLSFEILERLKEEDLPYVRDTLLKERPAHWRATLNASAA